MPSVLYSECESDVGNIHTGRYDLMSAVFINVTKDGCSENDLIGMLWTMFGGAFNAEDKKRTLSEEYGLPMTRETSEEVNSMCNYGESIYEDGKAAGKAEGLAEGKAAGLAEATAQYQSQLDAKDAQMQGMQAEIASLKAQLAGEK